MQFSQDAGYGRLRSVLTVHRGVIRGNQTLQLLHALLLTGFTPMTYRRPELKAFATDMRTLRASLKVDQVIMANHFGVSPRLLSDWENGYSQPDVKQRLHFLYTLSQLDPDWVGTFASYFGLAEHPAIVPLLEDDADDNDATHDGQGQAPAAAQVDAPLQQTTDLAPPRSPPYDPPAPQKRAPEDLRAQIDAALREAADAVDVRASDLRRGLYAVLGVVAQQGASIDDVRAALEATREKRRPS